MTSQILILKSSAFMSYWWNTSHEGTFFSFSIKKCVAAFIREKKLSELHFYPWAVGSLLDSWWVPLPVDSIFIQYAISQTPLQWECCLYYFKWGLNFTNLNKCEAQLLFCLYVPLLLFTHHFPFSKSHWVILTLLNFTEISVGLFLHRV